MSLQPAVFLDRDGVLNECRVIEGRPYPPESIQTFRVIDGALAACQLLKASGFLLVVVTNQPDIGRGTQSAAAVDEMHELLLAQLPLDAVYVCPHGGDTDCHCRKPKPGMLLDACRDLNIAIGESYMIGDRWRDVNCGTAAGCKTAFIDYGYSEQLRDTPDVIVKSITEAAEWIVADIALVPRDLH